MALAIDLHEGQPPDEHARAFTALYREFAEPLVRYCRGLTGPNGDPEALAHEALLRAWASWDPSSGRPFWPWVVTVARRLAIDQYRKTARRHRRHHAELEMSTADRFPQPEDEAQRNAEHALMRLALADLPDTYRRFVRMHHVEGLSYDEIARREETTVEAVRGTLRRARHALRAAYNRLELGVPAVLLIAGRRVRTRVDDWVARLQSRMHPSLPELAASEAFRGAVVLAVALATAAPVATADKPLSGRGPMAVAVAAPAQAGTDASVAGAASGFRGAGSAGMGGDAQPLPDGEAHAVPDTPKWLPKWGEGATSPEEATFSHLTAAPRSGSRTVFASGTAHDHPDCGRISCSVLLRSTDGGATWSRLPAAMFFGGAILLPPAWHDDPRIFAVGPHAVSVSTDGGASFYPITPRGHRAAMSPGFSSGDPHIWVGFLPGWDYDDRTHLVSPVKLSPLPTGHYNTFAFAPQWPRDARVFVGSWRPTAGRAQKAVVTLCTDGRCARPVELPGATAMPELMVPGAFARNGVAFAWSGAQLFRTVDGGASFQALTLPEQVPVTGVVAGPGDRIYLSLAGGTADSPAGGLYSSDDWGQTWRSLTTDARLDAGVAAVTPFAGGRLLAAPQASAGGGLLCSADGGATWAPRCSPPR